MHNKIINIVETSINKKDFNICTFGKLAKVLSVTMSKDGIVKLTVLSLAGDWSNDRTNISGNIYTSVFTWKIKRKGEPLYLNKDEKYITNFNVNNDIYHLIWIKNI